MKNSKIKAIILDADGVLILSDKRFSQHYSEKFDVPLETMMPFFKNEFEDCLIGKKDLKVELEKVLNFWKWDSSAQELMEYWFENNGVVNQPLLKLLPKIKSKGVRLYMGTNNEKHRTNYIFHNLGLKKHLDSTYASGHLGLKKPSQEYFEHVINDLNLPPNEILFVDDDERNIDGARATGMSVIQYTTLKSFKQSIKNYI